MTTEGSTKMVNFMTPRAGVLVLGCGHISHIVKMHYFFKSLLLYAQALIRHTTYIVLMTRKGLPNFNFHDPRGWGLMLGRGHISHYSEYVVSSTLSIYCTLVAIVLWDYDAAIVYHR